MKINYFMIIILMTILAYNFNIVNAEGNKNNETVYPRITKSIKKS